MNYLSYIIIILRFFLFLTGAEEKFEKIFYPDCPKRANKQKLRKCSKDQTLWISPPGTA